MNFKEKKNIQQELNLLFCSLNETGVYKRSNMLLWNLKVPQKRGTTLVQTLKNFEGLTKRQQ